MNLTELFESSMDYQDLKADNSQPKLGDLRKTKLTLRQINKLRRMHDVRAYEFKEKLERVKKQYAPAPAAPAI